MALSKSYKDQENITQAQLNDEENLDNLLKNIAKDSSSITSNGIETDNNLIVKIDVNDVISINNDVNFQKLDYYEKPNNLIQTSNNAVNIKLKCNIFNGKLNCCECNYIIMRNSCFSAIIEDHVNETDQVKSTNIVNKDQKIKFDNSSAATIITVVRSAKTFSFSKRMSIVCCRLKIKNVFLLHSIVCSNHRNILNHD